MPRLFVAAWPSPAIVSLLESMPRPAVPGVRWTRPSHWHVTLGFLGESDLDNAVAALAEVRHRAVDAVLGSGLRRLGRDALVIPVAGLDGLAAAVEQRFGVASPALGRGGFVGHLTVGRLRPRVVPPDVALPEVTQEGQRTWSVGEIVLVQSDLRPEGASYTIVARRSLSDVSEPPT